MCSLSCSSLDNTFYMHLIQISVLYVMLWFINLTYEDGAVLGFCISIIKSVIKLLIPYSNTLFANIFPSSKKSIHSTAKQLKHDLLRVFVFR